ncbi:MAG: transporter substrate-binding domain-containing protein [Spirochaetes bacterium]|nr:transporter substrate-binding domain-containing protein [Spirochaetota bacterium]
MKFLKKFVLILILFLLVLCLFNCKAKKEVVFNVGTNAEYPPFEFKEGEEFKGIDMELIKLVANELGMKINIIDMDFDALIPSLQAKKIDAAIAAITITSERAQVVDFTIPYYIANQAIIAKKESSISISSPEDLAKYKIGVQNGTTGQIYIDENFVSKGKMPPANLVKYPTNIEAITDMLNGNVDLVIIDDTAALGYSKLKPIKIIFTIDTGENYGIALPKGSKLLEKINNVLKKILNSDSWNNILLKYL